MRQLLVDPDHERQLDEQGYVVFDVLPPAAVEILAAAQVGQEHSGFSVTMSLEPGEQKRHEDDLLRATFDEHVLQHFIDVDVLTTGFAVKGVGSESALSGHLDWSVVDETEHRSLNVWVALCDMSQENGGLAVVPGSQRLPFTRRGARTVSPLSVVGAEATAELQVVPVRAGQAVVYEPKLIHGSGANRSGRVRLAVVACLVPIEAVPVHYVADRRGAGAEVREVVVDHDFYRAYELDTSVGHDPHIDELVAGRPARVVPGTEPFTTADLCAAGIIDAPAGNGRELGRRIAGRLRRVAQR